MMGARVLAVCAAAAIAATPALAQDSSQFGGDLTSLRGLFEDDWFTELPTSSLAGVAQPVAGDPAWNQTFTLTPSGDIGYLSNNSVSLDESFFSLGDDRAWGFTLAVQEATAPWSDIPELESYRAGAFVNLGSRFRLGGSLRFSDAERDVLFFDGSASDDIPEIKLQSAFRF